MKKCVGGGLLALSAMILWAASAVSQPPGGGRGGPPRFELGRVLPRHVRDEIELTREQEAEVARLEKEVKERLEKILTAAQKKKIETLPPRGAGGRGPGGGPPGGRDRSPADRPAQPEPEKKPKKDGASRQAVHWFATWESGLSEAKRTGRPILLVSAAPHCAGVSGTW